MLSYQVAKKKHIGSPGINGVAVARLAMLQPRTDRKSMSLDPDWGRSVVILLHDWRPDHITLRLFNIAMENPL